MTNTTMTDTTFDTSARSDSYLDAILNPDLDPAIIPTVHELDDLMCAMDLHVAFNREAKAELRETGSVAGTRNKLARTYTALNKRLGSSRKLGVQGEVLQQQFRDLLDNQYQPTAETVATLAKITEATSRASLNNTVTTWSGHTAFTLFDATCRDLRTVLTRYRTVRGLPPAPDLLALAKAPHSLILAVSYLMAKAGPAILNAAADKDAATLDPEGLGTDHQRHHRQSTGAGIRNPSARAASTGGTGPSGLQRGHPDWRDQGCGGGVFQPG
ncbi:MAG: hypothetical protein IPI16_05415 [Comamonadaceae bacterium]|nr:hypothetical protein [Comamonadaceae bacterium]